MKPPAGHRNITVIFLLILASAAFSEAQQPGLVPVNDTGWLVPGIPVTLNLLANDTVPPGDSIVILAGSDFPVWSITPGTGGNVTFTLLVWGTYKTRVRQYRLKNFTTGALSKPASIVFHVRDNSLRSLDINNVSALFNASGMNFLYTNNEEGIPKGFEVPKGGGRNTILTQSLWVGGFDGIGHLHLAGETYRTGPFNSQPGTKRDFWAGPVSAPEFYSMTQDTLWNYLWKVNRAEIDYHRNHYWETGYIAPPDILNWPGNGNVLLGQAHRLAPFSDRNCNGLYEPYDGDYPEIRGDQALFFVYNDHRELLHASIGIPMKVEVHGMAYAFNRPADTAFKNTVFLHYKVFNRSEQTYTQTRFGIFTDFDLGAPNDDFIGCDVERGMFYAYNGPATDGNGEPTAYGLNPPAQAVVFLAGPRMDPDGYDNPSYKGNGLHGPSFSGSCDLVNQDSTLVTMSWGPGGINQGTFLVRAEAINGFGFGDGTPDNERMGMTTFYYTYDQIPGIPSSFDPFPGYAFEFYQIMDSRWRDSLKNIYGGNARPEAGGYGPECNFMFPELTDKCNWGTNGALPNGPKEWTERTAGNTPQNRQGAASSGSFAFGPGDMQEFDIAFVWARNYQSNDSTLRKLNAAVDSIRSRFFTNSIPGGGIFYGMEQKQKPTGLFIHPNPVKDLLSVRIPGNRQETGTYSLFSMSGTEVSRGNFHGSGIVIPVDRLPAGLYILRVATDRQIFYGRVIVQR